MSVADPRLARYADALIDAWDHAGSLAPITASDPAFDIPAAYEVLLDIESRRIAAGWRPVGRKIGFTNRTIWPRYGVHVPMWARIWEHTVHSARDGRGTLPLAPVVRPRIEPEIVFGLRDGVAADADIAPGFEIVQSHFPAWKFGAPDCTAAFGLHGWLMVGERVRLDDAIRARLAELLPRFEVTLYRGDRVIDRGVGSNVLDGPAHALRHLARVLESQPRAPRLAAGEIVTTGTITDAWPVAPGETWRSDYGELGLRGVELTFE